MDDLIASTGVALRALCNPSFMDNIVRRAAAIANRGMFFSLIDGDRKLPSVATRDIAAAASRLLLDDTWSGVSDVPLLGPEDLSFNDMAQIMSDVLGKEVRFQQTTFEAYKEQFVGFAMSDAMAQGMTDMASATNEGLYNGVQRTPENSTPSSFREWSEEVLKPAVLNLTGQPRPEADHQAIRADLRSPHRASTSAFRLQRRRAQHGRRHVVAAVSGHPADSAVHDWHVPAFAPYSHARRRAGAVTAIQRIDVHQHVVPPFYAEELPACGGDPSGSVTP